METPPDGIDLAQLIQWIKGATGDTDSDIARRIGAAPSTVNAWVHRLRGTGRGPKRETLRALAHAYNLPEDRVFAAAGRKTPGPLTPDQEAELLRYFRDLTEEQQQAKLVEMRALAQHNRASD
ncbi:XRE family transcriptional regulator [Streptomyces macrosporus]|uniref:PRELI/MSF1 domain-containing protein n=1 Tax=Streptomyces macrosporus TaxID=44032 RepID=A0ABN3KEH9_9ACTN